MILDILPCTVPIKLTWSPENFVSLGAVSISCPAFNVPAAVKSACPDKCQECLPNRCSVPREGSSAVYFGHTPVPTPSLYMHLRLHSGHFLCNCQKHAKSSFYLSWKPIWIHLSIYFTLSAWINHSPLPNKDAEDYNSLRTAHVSMVYIIVFIQLHPLQHLQQIPKSYGPKNSQYVFNICIAPNWTRFRFARS